MAEEQTAYEALVTALKSLTQAEDPAATDSPTVTLPVAENDWNTRPDAESYGIVSLDFEAGALRAENVKQDEAFEGSVDLFSRAKDGAGWIPLIRDTLTAHCGGSWSLNSHVYERDARLFHWEWTFQIEG